MSIHPHFALASTDRTDRRAFHEIFQIEAEHILRTGFHLAGHRFTGDVYHLASIRLRSMVALKNDRRLAMTGEVR